MPEPRSFSSQNWVFRLLPLSAGSRMEWYNPDCRSAVEEKKVLNFVRAELGCLCAPGKIDANSYNFQYERAK